MKSIRTNISSNVCSLPVHDKDMLLVTGGVVFDYKQSDIQIPQGPMFINKIQAGYKKESRSKHSFERRFKTLHSFLLNLSKLSPNIHI